MTLNNYRDFCHKRMEKWWQDPSTGARIERNKLELLMLIVSELAEAMEGARKDKNDDKLPHRKMEEVELADTLIRMFDYAGGFNIDLEQSCPITPKNPVDLNDYRAPLSRYKGTNKGAQLMGIVISIAKAAEAACSFRHEKEERNLGTTLFLIFAYATEFNLDLQGAFEEKMEFNRIREDHTHEARLKADGKKF